MKNEINARTKKHQKKGREIDSFATKNTINTDPNGSWTGVSTENQYENPVQDVDDL